MNKFDKRAFLPLGDANPNIKETVYKTVTGKATRATASTMSGSFESTPTWLGRCGPRPTCSRAARHVGARIGFRVSIGGACSL